MSIAIRSFAMSDYEPVIRLWCRAELEISRSDSYEQIQKKLQRDPELFLVAVEGNKIIGAVIGAYDGRRGWVYHLAVDSDEQRKGVGYAMMKELESRFQAIGCEKVNLLIEPNNAQVQGFYERLGFQSDELIFMEKWVERTKREINTKS
ncbi:GNAT family acetyltransferase [Brevibacillus humidisoli]|uniref:GNAT family acetyltransferase n=1 Tax=Brevibacillus humidisoli TaxID=2895522 RepID=UPI001E5F8010|nr:GNAT family acetyltransferase [Brevibacillus humidisoli]UFJ41153.1 GNAT family acetyltransferase [Brevibacillus humidisoli]